MITDFSNDNNNNNASFKFNQKKTGQASYYGTNDVEIMISFKYLSNFLGTLEMSLKLVCQFFYIIY